MAAAAAPAPQGEGDKNTTGFSLLTAKERFMLAITGCRNHNWSFPQSSKEMKKAYAANAPYDSHQQCPSCGSMRLFNSKTFEAGPLFHKEPTQNG